MLLFNIGWKYVSYFLQNPRQRLLTWITDDEWKTYKRPREINAEDNEDWLSISPFP